MLQGCLNWFLPHPHEGLHLLQELDTGQTGLNRDDLLHLVELLEKLPCLEELDLARNSLHQVEDALENFVRSCVTNPRRKLQLELSFNNLSETFVSRISFLCEKSNTKIHFDETESGDCDFVRGNQRGGLHLNG